MSNKKYSIEFTKGVLLYAWNMLLLMAGMAVCPWRRSYETETLGQAPSPRASFFAHTFRKNLKMVDIQAFHREGEQGARLLYPRRSFGEVGPKPRIEACIVVVF